MKPPLFWCCPSCRQALSAIHSHSVSCENGHNYDRAKQGYLNLLLANKKRSDEPGDSPEMIHARHLFLQAGYYDFLVRKLGELIAAEFLSDEIAVLDLGCGEGYYTRELAKRFPSFDIWGIDISKAAIKLAASNNRCGHYAVASAVDVPLPSESVDVIVNIFAPLHPAEIKRLLKPNGLLLRVSPAAEHLTQIKSLIYSEARAHAVPDILADSYLAISELIQERVTLDNADLHHLLNMTPMQWRSKGAMKETFSQIQSLNVDFQFLIQGMRYAGK